jgi:hypothetical protein
MSRRILGMRTTNWSSLSTNCGRATSQRLDRGEYEWSVVIIGSNDKIKDSKTIRADSFDDAVKKAQGLIQYGEAVTVDGRKFTK